MSKIRKYFSNIRRKYLLGFRIDGRGERVHIDARSIPLFESMDMYQKSHIRRYEFAINFIKNNYDCADMACGTGYGTVLLSKKAKSVVGVDLDGRVIKEIKKRYADIKNVSFIHKNLLRVNFVDKFDVVVSFETIEHLRESDIPALFSVFSKAIKKGGLFVFSTPYKQEKTKEAVDAGFHLTFGIDESKIQKWLENAGFSEAVFEYQNYETHDISPNIEPKHFIIGVARKNG